MATPARVTDSLKRLSGLERGKGTLSKSLSKGETLHEIHRLRSILPAFILGHHDRKIQMGKASIVPVVNGICSACHLSLPSGHAARLRSSQDLEVCDNCGTFIFLEHGAEPALALLPTMVRKNRATVCAA
ncbi:MAG: C4-type zinc ribbon domain-containing protein [Terrimicrobiaceae bacterium]